MARLPYRDKDDLAPEYQDLLKRPINLHRMLVNSPAGAKALSPAGTYIRHGSKLDGRLRELAILQVGYIYRAPYEWSHHVKIGHDFGVTDDDIRGLIAYSEGQPCPLDDITKTVLSAATQLSVDADLSDATFNILRAHFNTEDLVDLLVTITYYNHVVRILAALQIDVEESYQKYLDQFPLPPKKGKAK